MISIFVGYVSFVEQYNKPTECADCRERALHLWHLSRGMEGGLEPEDVQYLPFCGRLCSARLSSPHCVHPHGLQALHAERHSQQSGWSVYQNCLFSPSFIDGLAYTAITSLIELIKIYMSRFKAIGLSETGSSNTIGARFCFRPLLDALQFDPASSGSSRFGAEKPH